jgi:hypothetical protein
MNLAAVACPRCRTDLPVEIFNQPDLAACPACNTLTQVRIFPAFFRELDQGEAPASVLSDTEASCFYHPQKRAVIPCEACGRFLCALCDLDFNGQHLCPTCLETGQTKDKIKNLQTQRTCYDSIALTLALVPMLLFWATIITAPMTLYVAVRYWKQPCSVVPRGKWRFIAAIVIAALQIIGWAILIIVLMNR